MTRLLPFDIPADMHDGNVFATYIALTPPQYFKDRRERHAWLPLL
jgi:hypothetical protein